MLEKFYFLIITHKIWLKICIKTRIEQVKSRKSSNVNSDTQTDIFDKHNTIDLPYFGQISKIIHFMLKKLKIHNIFRMPFGMEGLISLDKDVLNRFEKKWFGIQIDL